MQKKIITSALLFLSLIYSFAQETPITLKTNDGDIEGSLLMPANITQKVPIVLLISGSGPTDRNGNVGDQENNSLKYLAEELLKRNIASLRYDKRGVGTSVSSEEAALRFETYVNDAKAWITLLSKDVRFSKISVAGHSEGSLVGILASQKNKQVSSFISIAGAGRAADEVIKEQLANVHESVKPTIFKMIDDLKKGDTITDVPMIFYALFRPSIQPYMTSWFKYNPAIEIKKLSMPILITQGDKDIQVKVIDAQNLSAAVPKAKLKIITNMNHVLKTCDTMEKEKQTPTYSNPDLPIVMELVDELEQFMKSSSK